RIEKTLGRAVSLASLFRSPTIESLARELRQEGESAADWALMPFRTGGTKPLLFLYGGSFELSRHLGEDRPCYGVKLWPDGGRAPETVEEMAADCLRQIRCVQSQGPYFIGGYSFGGLVAYETAQQLRQSGQEVKLLVLIDPTSLHWPSVAVPETSGSKYRLAFYRHWRRLREMGFQELA